MPLLRERAISGRHNFRGDSLEAYAFTGLLAALAQRAGVRIPPLVVQATNEEPIKARLHHDQWIADCPDCSDASYVWHDTPLLMCANCFNGEAGGRWRLVALPSERMIAAIEEIVGHRPLPHNRNWEPGETLAQLRRDNIKNGVSIPTKGGAA